MSRFQKFIPYIFLVCGIFFFSPSPSQSGSKKQGAFLKIKKSKYNFGFVRQGAIVKIECFFKNSGTDTLRISNIEVACGCTVADFPHYPIKPGDSGIILITFNTKDKFDRQDRTADVLSNAVNSPTRIRFKGVILVPKAQSR